MGQQLRHHAQQGFFVVPDVDIPLNMPFRCGSQPSKARIIENGRSSRVFKSSPFLV